MLLTNVLVDRSSDDSFDFIGTGGSPVIRRPGGLPGPHPQFGSPPRFGAARSAAYGMASVGSRDSPIQRSPHIARGIRAVEPPRSGVQSVRERPSLLNGSGHSLRPDAADVTSKSDLWTGDQLGTMLGTGGVLPVDEDMRGGSPSSCVSRVDGLKRKRFDDNDVPLSKQSSLAKSMKERAKLPSTIFPGETLEYEWSMLD